MNWRGQAEGHQAWQGTWKQLWQYIAKRTGNSIHADGDVSETEGVSGRPEKRRKGITEIGVQLGIHRM